MPSVLRGLTYPISRPSCFREGHLRDTGRFGVPRNFSSVYIHPNTHTCKKTHTISSPSLLQHTGNMQRVENSILSPSTTLHISLSSPSPCSVLPSHHTLSAHPPHQTYSLSRTSSLTLHIPSLAGLSLFMNSRWVWCNSVTRVAQHKLDSAGQSEYCFIE